MTAAAGAARASTALVGDPSTAPDVRPALALVVVAGLVEGAALGTAQAAALGRLLPGLVAAGGSW